MKQNHPKKKAIKLSIEDWKAFYRMTLEWQSAKQINAPEAMLRKIARAGYAKMRIRKSGPRFKIRQYIDEPEKPSEWEPDYEKAPRRIVCAAMRKNGRIITGARHFDRIMRDQMRATEGLRWWRGCEQGFIDQFGQFLNRKDAWIVAEQANQIIQERVVIQGRLFSECVY